MQKQPAAQMALYSVKEIKNLYLYKANYQILLQEIEKLKRENWHLKQLILHNK